MIYDKPFSFSEMLRRTIFLGRPNFFNAKDFNKELLIIHSFIEEFNKVFAVTSNLEFSITSFTENLNSSTNVVTRTLNIQWTGGTVLYNGVKFNITADGISGYTQTFTKPDDTISPKEVRPNTYLVLSADLQTITYADNPVLCGIQSDEVLATVPTVNVEQYKNIEIHLTGDPSSIPNAICVLATIHPRHKEDGSDNGTGFLYHTYNNPIFLIKNGTDRQSSNLANNNTLFEYILENVILKLNKVVNERQLIRRFNLADIENFNKARHNLGFSNLVNHRQLVRAENLRDLQNPAMARQNLGLGNSAVRNVGAGANDVAPGNVLPIGGIMIWSGAVNSIPSGWALCDGSNNTPDLRGRFVVGHASSVPDFNLIGKQGGGEAILTQNNLPKHTHEINDPGHTHAFSIIGGGDDHSSGRHSNKRNDRQENYVTQSATTGITILPSGGQDNPTPIKTLPPYYTLCYIMYVGVNFTPPTPLPADPTLVYPNYSVSDTTTDGGFASYTPDEIGGSNEFSVGAGVILTNPQ